MTNKNLLREIFEWIIILLKYCRRQCILLPPTWAKSLTKFTTKMQNFQLASGLKLQVKRGLNNLIFLIGFQMLKIRGGVLEDVLNWPRGHIFKSLASKLKSLALASNQYLNCRGDAGGRVPPSRISVPPSRFRRPLIEIGALND